jgi:hypothetical protein
LVHLDVPHERRHKIQHVRSGLGPIVRVVFVVAVPYSGTYRHEKDEKMKKFLLGVFLGAGVGSVATSIFLFDRAMRSPSIRQGMVDATSDRIYKTIYGEEPTPFRYRYSSYDYRRKNHEDRTRSS